MSQPSIGQLYDVIDQSWPALRRFDLGPFTLRQGANGGSRVSAATTLGPVTSTDIDAAETAMRNMEQPRLFMIREWDTALDADLNDRGYRIKDPVNVYVAPVEQIALKRPPQITTFEVWPPLVSQIEVWQAGGIGAGRLAVMQRANHPKTTLMGRVHDRPAGAVFVGTYDNIAMVHAMETAAQFRRNGLARHMVTSCAFWAKQQCQSHLSMVCTQANDAANGLYTSMGFACVGQYHYRIHPEDT